jgi:hypothetical protein
MSERIDHNNYEAWLLDRMEGRLDPTQEAMLDAFLAAHPDLDPTEDGLPTLDLADTRLPEFDKDPLKRTLPPTGAPADSLDDFLIARGEGDLTAEQLIALRGFLKEHPEHQRSERLYAIAKVIPDATAYTAKNDLVRDLPPRGMPGPHTLEDLLVARLEGDLSEEQERVLVAYLVEHPEAKQAWALMQRTRVARDPVVYADKQGLKKGAKVIALTTARSTWGVRLRVAAMVAVLFGLGFWLLTRENAPEQQFVQEGSTVQPIDTADGTTGTPDPSLVKGSGADTNAPHNDPDVNEDERLMTDDTNGQQGPATAPFPNMAVEREQLAVLTAIAPVLNSTSNEGLLPVSVPVRDGAWAPVEFVADEELYAAEERGIPLRSFLANVFRERVLDEPAAAARPLDGDDAVAVVDKGLRTVVGERSGLAVERGADGVLSGFDLRLGRNLAISAKR